MVNSNPQHNQRAPGKRVAVKDCPDQAVLWACLWGTVLIALTAMGRHSLKMHGTVPWLGALDSIQVEEAS